MKDKINMTLTQQIKFTGNLDQAAGAAMFFAVAESK